MIRRLLPFAACVLSLGLFAQDGSLDTTFGNDGIVTTEFYASHEYATASVIQPDGKIVVAGNNGIDYFGGDLVLVRFNDDGTLDNSFGEEGIATIKNMGSAISLAMQPNGKFVLANATALIRINANGGLDDSFGIDGIQTVYVDGWSRISSVALQPDGKIVTSGTSLRRFLNDGSIDTPFLNGISSGFYQQVLAIQSDEKIITAGTKANDFALARFNPDGTSDNSFGINGILTTDLGSENEGVKSIAVQSDGKILVAGYFKNGDNYNIALTRYNLDGTLDENFGLNGLLKTDVNTRFNGVVSIALQSDEKIILAGTTVTISDVDVDFNLARYKPNGDVDDSFGSNGIVTIDIGITDKAKFIAIQADGNIVVAGDSDFDFALARIDNVGVLDNVFGGGGKLIVNTGTTRDGAADIAVQPDGKIVVVGTAGDNDNDCAVARYGMNGLLDNSFSSNGIHTFDFAPDCSSASAVAIQPDGKILIAGASSGCSPFSDGSTLMVTRFLTDGSLDDGFGSNGIQSLPVPFPIFLPEMMLQPDGKILLLGDGVWDNYYSFLVRLNTDGSLDENFNSGGIQSDSLRYSSFAILPDGKILLSGNPPNSNNHALTLIRYNYDGTLDDSFGSGGIQALDLPDWERIGDIALQSNGKIIAVGGEFFDGTDHNISLARFNPDGTVDNSFVSSGIQLVNLWEVSDLVIQPDDKIILSRTTKPINGNSDFALVRFNQDGSLDDNFGINGTVITDVGIKDYANAITLQPDGKIVLAGTSDDDFAIVRYLTALNTGVIDFSSPKNSALVYPNPASQFSTLEYTLEKEKEISIQLVDMQGKLLKTFVKNEIQQKGKQIQMLEFPVGLAPGYYSIVLSSEEGRVAITIVL